MSDLPEGMFESCGKLYGICRYCKKVVRIDKPVLGSMHICVTSEERQQIDDAGINDLFKHPHQKK